MEDEDYLTAERPHIVGDTFRRALLLSRKVGVLLRRSLGRLSEHLPRVARMWRMSGTARGSLWVLGSWPT